MCEQEQEQKSIAINSRQRLFDKTTAQIKTSGYKFT
jgi:hypothetical protein